MPIGMEVGLSPGDFVLDGDPAPPKRAQPSPIFGICLLWSNGWIDQDATWYGGRPRPRRLCVRWGPIPPPQKKRGHRPHSFRPMSIVAKRSPVSAAAELLLTLLIVAKNVCYIVDFV